MYMYMRKHSIHRVQHYSRFQSSNGHLGTYPLRIQGDYCISLCNFTSIRSTFGPQLFRASHTRIEANVQGKKCHYVILFMLCIALKVDFIHTKRANNKKKFYSHFCTWCWLTFPFHLWLRWSDTNYFSTYMMMGHNDCRGPRSVHFFIYRKKAEPNLITFKIKHKTYFY